MKKIITKFIFLSVGCVTLLSACGDFEEINTNDQGVSQKMLLRDGVQSGGYIQTLEQSIIPIGTAANGTDIINQYQIAFNIGQDTWSGYFSQNADWNSGNNHSTYSFVYNNWIESTFKSTYTSSFAPWLSIKSQYEAGGPAEAYALAQILKISAWHQAADTFGPIPYTQAGTGLFVTPYDAQDVVYKSMLKDLKDAVDALTEYMNIGGTSFFSDYDLIYGGKVENWIKYGNSLMLRLAMRIRFAEPAIAKEYAEAAVSHSVGVMKDASDGATIGSASGLQFINPIKTLAATYNETRMGASMMAYLGGYEDPRLPRYFLPSTKPNAIALAWLGSDNNTFLPIAPGNTYRDDKDNSSKPNVPSSLPNIEDETPVRILLASEVYFLRAEGALVGWNMGGDAKQLYEDGIRISFEENGVKTDEADTYMAGEKAPMKVDLTSVPSVGKVLSVATNETVKFEGTDEQKLQKIITQKWIALYPNGQEAWSEWRRTGYPVLIPVIHNTSNGVISTDSGVRRMPYYSPSARSAEEQEAYDKAVELLGGSDNGATKLWWDKK